MTVSDARADIPAVNDAPAEATTPTRPYKIFGQVIYGRVLVCTRCKTSVEVYEAAEGATSPEEHDWVDPDEYVCGHCLDPEAEAITIPEEGLLDG